MNFSAICLPDTSTKEEGYVFFCKFFTSKLRSDLNIISDAIEFLYIEILNKHSKKLVLDLGYRLLQGRRHKIWEKFTRSSVETNIYKKMFL